MSGLIQRLFERFLVWRNRHNPPIRTCAKQALNEAWEARIRKDRERDAFVSELRRVERDLKH